MILKLDINNIPDMNIYYSEFSVYSELNLFEALSLNSKEELYVLVNWTLSKITTNFEFYIIITWLIFIMVLLFALRKIASGSQLLIIFIAYVFHFVFFSYALNAVRQGLAMVIIIYAASMLISDKYQNKYFYFTVFIPPLVHLSSLPFVLYLLLLKIKKIPLSFTIIFWLFSCLLLLTDLNIMLMKIITNQRLLTYATEVSVNDYSNGTNRVDFLILGFIIIIIGLFFRTKLEVSDKSAYDILLNIFIMFNAIAQLFGFISYSDRLNAFSWFLIPVLIMYPIALRTNYRREYLIPTILLFIIIGIFVGNFNYFK